MHLLCWMGYVMGSWDLTGTILCDLVTQEGWVTNSTTTAAVALLL